MTKNAILLGNGLSRASNNKSWTDMLEVVRKKYGVEDENPYTNLPLEFERVYWEAKKRGAIKNTYALKSEIASSISSAVDLSLIRMLSSLPCHDIMTTNYDYYIEEALHSSFNRSKNTSNTKERKNSIYRHIHVSDKRVWHIHGEAHCPDSVCLGYEQYCTYMSAMINHLAHPPESRLGITSRPLLRYYLEGGQIKSPSWLLLFFTHDIHILGLTMSLLEIDLWWLLSYRRRFMLDNPTYKISNRIYYYYADHDGKISGEQISLLKSLDVELCQIPLENDNWRNVYTRAITQIGQKMNAG